MATELGLVGKWLFDTLTGDATFMGLLHANGNAAGDVYPNVLPEEATYPSAIINFQSGVDVNPMTTDSERTMVDTIYQVKVIGKGNNPDALEPIVDRMDKLLQKKFAVVTGGRLTTDSIGPVQYLETDGNVKYLHYGRLYRIIVKADAA